MNDDDGYHFAVVTIADHFLVLEWSGGSFDAPVVLDSGRVSDHPIRLTIKDELDKVLERYFSYKFAGEMIMRTVSSGEVPPHLFESAAKIFAMRSMANEIADTIK